VLRYLSPVGSALAAASLATAGGYFVAAVTSGHPQPWWPYVLLFGAMALGGLLYLIGQRHPRTGASGSTTAANATGKHDTPAATATRPAPATAEDGIPATAKTPSHPTGMADESGRRTGEPGTPSAGASRPPGPAVVLTAGQRGQSGPGPGSDRARRILMITLACATLASAAVVSSVLARSPTTYPRRRGLGPPCSARRRMGRRADGHRGPGNEYFPGSAHQLHRHLARNRLEDPSRRYADCGTPLSCWRYLSVHIRPAGRRSVRADQYDL
jgi:hypothetical protein